MPSVLESLHTGGICKAVTIKRQLVGAVVSHLIICPDHGGTHVFVVDASKDKMVTIGLAPAGYQCVVKYFKDEWGYELGS